MSIISSIFDLVGRAITPIANLIDDERFTPEEKAQLQNSETLAAMAEERARLEIEKLEWQVQVETEKRRAAEAMAAADRQTALAEIQAAQTAEDDLFTKRLRPTVGYLMTLMLMVDLVFHLFFGRPRFFGLAELTGYFAIMGVYIGGRSIEKIKRKHTARQFVGPLRPEAQ